MAAEENNLSAAIEATKHLLLRDLPEHAHVGPMPVGGVKPSDLPLKLLNDQTVSITHFFDIVVDVEPNIINLDNLQAVIRDKAWADLPEPLTPKVRPSFSYVMQYFIIPQASNDKLCVIKHYYVKDEKINGAAANLIIRGTGHEISWGTCNKKSGRKALQWMMEQMGGTQYRHFSLSSEKKKPTAGKIEQNEEEEDLGWDFILKHGELDRSMRKQLRWIHRWMKKEGSPIKGWSEKLIARALDNMANDGCLAKLITRYDLSMRDIEEEVRLLFEPLVPHLQDHSLLLLGEPGKGKTPLGRTIAMMFSRFRGGEGTFRTASDFDFFRGLVFNSSVPALFDNGEIGNEPVKKKKAFSDVGDAETILKERWNAAKFVQHQLRIVLDNAYDPIYEPEDDGTDESLTVSHLVFMKIIRPALGFITNADSMAILKRGVFVVFGKQHIYYRPPSAQDMVVKRIRWSKFDIVKDTSKPTLSNFKKSGPPPLNYEAECAWEAEWLKEAIRKHDQREKDAIIAVANAALAEAEARQSPMYGIPFMKVEQAEFLDMHEGLANATRDDPIDCNNDPVTTYQTYDETEAARAALGMSASSTAGRAEVIIKIEPSSRVINRFWGDRMLKRSTITGIIDLADSPPPIGKRLKMDTDSQDVEAVFDEGAHEDVFNFWGGVEAPDEDETVPEVGPELCSAPPSTAAPSNNLDMPDMPASDSD
ncbi:unnamed protein product [Polarella glacialis]|uniref:Uncharacterized protein n=1 Tax=Polarella glacialis TaxID=89957 RepID=A0A813JR24_POLGL|nr:unnamed protein product [Polarella glacialis]